MFLHLIIVLTAESKERMIKNYGVSSSRLKVIPLGCVETPQILDKETCKKKLNLMGKIVLTIPGFVSKNHVRLNFKSPTS